jgi:hypothetical protein
MTPFPQAMPEHYRQSNTVEAYRAYYRGEKSQMAKWEPLAQIPSWFLSTPKSC